MVGTDQNLDALAYVLYLISQKRIPMWRGDFEEVKRRKKFSPLTEFMRKPTDFDHFRSLDRATKIHQLVRLGYVLKLALHPLFYRKGDDGAGETTGEDTAAKAQADRLEEKQKHEFPPSARFKRAKRE
jgi:hypothetical protein